MKARSFIKWAGGKTQLLPELLRRVPTSFVDYFEPFVGGGALFFALTPPTSHHHVTLSDSNDKLINCYEHVRDHAAKLLLTMTRLAADYNTSGYKRECYEAARKRFNSPTTERIDQAALFIFLNKTGFNGLYRVSQGKGEFNVPWGKRDRFEVDVENIEACSVALRGVKLFVRDFEEVLGRAKKGDFAYCDPPYVPASASANFTAYAKKPFGPKEQERLHECARELKNRGGHVLLSNSDTPYVRELYNLQHVCGAFVDRPYWEIDRVEARRNINSKGDRRGKVGEVLIS